MIDFHFPTSFLDARGWAALQRIVGALERRGAWDPIFEAMAAMTATVCADYVTMACVASAEDATGEIAQLVVELRHDARTMLVEMEYLRPDQLHLSPVTADGLDADLVGVCAPLAGK